MANAQNQKLLRRNDLHATTLLILFLDEYGFEALDWDVETIKLEIEDDFNIQLADDQLGRLMAIIKALTTDDFYRSCPAFAVLCRHIAEDNVTPRLWAPPDAYDIAAAVAEVLLINPPDDLNTAFDPEILAFITVTLRRETILTPPDCLKFIPADDLAIQNLTNNVEHDLLFAAGYQQAVQNSEDLQLAVDMHIQGLVEELSQLQLEHGSLEELLASTSSERSRADTQGR